MLRVTFPGSTPDRVSILVLIVICVVVNIPYFIDLYYPVHDTLSVFQIFSYYYSELLINRAAPWWLPHTSYGMPIDSHLLFSFGPFQYLALAVGYLAGIKNTLYLFSTSLAFDSLMLGLGLLFFCQHIFKDKLCTLVCTVSILLLVFYDRQVYWNFKILVPIPFALYFLQRGIERLNPVYLLWVIAILLCWSFGSVTYTLVAQFYIITTYGIAFWASSILFKGEWFKVLFIQWRLLKKRLFSKKILVHSIIPTTVILICIAVLYTIRSEMRNHMAYNALGRDADMGVDLKTYLTYGGGGEASKLLEIFNGIPTSNPHDYLIYMGIVNFGFLLIGLLFIKKNASQIALILTTTLVIAFTIVATGVAELAYTFPGMNLIRHIAYFITVGKLLLIILAGFGVRALVNKGTTKSLYICLILAGVISACFTPFDWTSLYSIHSLVVSTCLIVFISITSIFKTSQRIVILGCLLISLIDMVSYRIIVFKMADLFLVSFPSEFKTVQESSYRYERIDQKDAAVLERYRLKPMDIYGGGDSYLREDFCNGSRQDLVAPGVKQLFQLRVWRDRIMKNPRDALDPSGDQTLKNLLGCGVPKLRLISHVIYAHDEEAAANLVCCRADIDSRPVIIAPLVTEKSELVIHAPKKDTIKVTEFSPNKLRINIFNGEPVAQWLIYSDAYDERWTATVDGASQQFYKANLAFKALRINPGQHEVVLNFSRPHMNVLFSIFAFVMNGIALVFIVFMFLVLFTRQQVRFKNKTSIT